MDFDVIFEKLSEHRKYAKENYIPIIRDKSAKFLYDYIINNDCNSILEIGTAIGYSGSIMLSANECRLTTVEISQDSFDMAKSTFAKFGYTDRVEMHLMDAKDLIADLVDKSAKFDLIFLDGAKGQYINYLPNLAKLIGNNGVIIADNVLLHGLVDGDDFVPHKKRTMVVNLRKYVDTISKSPYHTEFINIDDGLAITKYEGV